MHENVENFAMNLGSILYKQKSLKMFLHINAKRWLKQQKRFYDSWKFKNTFTYESIKEFIL